MPDKNKTTPPAEPAPDEHHEPVPQGEPRDEHPSISDEALKAAEAAGEGERIVEEETLSPKQKAKKLRKLGDEELIALAEEAAKADHWLDVARRTQAELDNTIKRLTREQNEALRYATGGLARELLPVVDNLQRALQAGEDKQDFKALFEGLKMTHKVLIDALERNHVRAIEAEGKPFDPAQHEALLTAAREDLDDNVVAMELEKGWKLHDRVLRASKVQVNKKG